VAIAGGILAIVGGARGIVQAASATCSGQYFQEKDDEGDPILELSCDGVCATTPPNCIQRLNYLPNNQVDTWCGCDTSPVPPPPDTSAGGCTLSVRMHFDPEGWWYEANCQKTDCEGACLPSTGTSPTHGWHAVCDCDEP
jgi:hypothetical protein